MIINRFGRISWALSRYYFVLCVLLFLGPVSSCYSCDLALHSWEKKFSFQLKLKDPFIIHNELKQIETRYGTSDLKGINCFLNSDSSILHVELFNEFMRGWVNRIPLSYLNKSYSDFLASGTDEILLGFKNPMLKISLFLDKNAQSRCGQLVFLQEMEARVAINRNGNLKAERFLGRHWLAIKFWDNPTPGRIISITVFPVGGHGTILYENNFLSEKLIMSGLLMRQNEGMADVQGPEIPEM